MRVGIVDDQQLVRHGFITLLTDKEDMEVVGEASDGREAVLLADRACPHALLMDVQMPEYSGIDATREILATCRTARLSF
ncbi:response regulator transcription factor [Paenibacillus profundus]|uniref:response regulator transcription factor n=1 Tax=Paenibacillus profundus TaxID=1173085 RepID=UPI002D7E6471|nr:response regulator [Paenibacillus profundus]